MGHDLICGSDSIVVSPYIDSGWLHVFNGKAFNAVNGALKYAKGLFRNLEGYDFNSITFFILGNVFLNRKSVLSYVPNTLETALKGLPFTFSKRIAGAFLFALDVTLGFGFVFSDVIIRFAVI